MFSDKIDFKQVFGIAFGLVFLVFIKQILLICGAVYLFKFAKANLLFAQDIKDFLNLYLGVDKSQ